MDVSSIYSYTYSQGAEAEHIKHVSINTYSMLSSTTVSRIFNASLELISKFIRR